MSRIHKLLKFNMKKFTFIFFLSITTNSFGLTLPKTAKSPTEFIPPGYVVFEEIRGDLNKDGLEDSVFIIKGTNKSKIVIDKFAGELDRNRRGIIIVFGGKNQYQLILENRECFSSENEDGGFYFPPDLRIYIKNGVLRLHYLHGRYGFWIYKFRYQNSDFELIGYDRSCARGPVVEVTTSINFLTKKMLIKKNINQDAESGEEQFAETWYKFRLPKLLLLRKIHDFDRFSIESHIEIIN